MSHETGITIFIAHNVLESLALFSSATQYKIPPNAMSATLHEQGLLILKPVLLLSIPLQLTGINLKLHIPLSNLLKVGNLLLVWYKRNKN